MGTSSADKATPQQVSYNWTQRHIASLKEDVRVLAEQVKLMAEVLGRYYPPDRRAQIGFVTNKFEKLDLLTKKRNPVANLIVLTEDLSGHVNVQIDRSEFHHDPLLPEDEQLRTDKWEHINDLMALDEIIKHHSAAPIKKEETADVKVAATS
jgi:hypothetical protein